ncbi:hypothetical protein FQZ97_988670 [compost metagenome]
MIVTPCFATCLAVPATKPVSPLRDALDRPNSGIGDFTDAEVMLTTRPQLLSIMPGRTAFISKIGVSMLAFSAFNHSFVSQSDHSPGGGPPALVTRMSAFGSASRSSCRPSTVVTSATTA